MFESFQALSWTGLVSAMLVFGFAPRFVLRLIVLAFHRDDPRREELLAELHAVPRLERPLWVAEQLELALCDGIWERIVWAATGRIIHRWHLTSGVESNRATPETFWIPSDEDKDLLEVGDHVKLNFGMRDGWGERMWVRIEKIGPTRLVGSLCNQPLGIPRLKADQRIRFTLDDIIDVDYAPPGDAVRDQEEHDDAA